MNKLYEKRRLRPPVNSAGWERALEEGPAGRLPQNGSQEAWDARLAPAAATTPASLLPECLWSCIPCGI